MTDGARKRAARHNKQVIAAEEKYQSQLRLAAAVEQERAFNLEREKVRTPAVRPCLRDRRIRQQVLLYFMTSSTAEIMALGVACAGVVRPGLAPEFLL